MPAQPEIRVWKTAAELFAAAAAEFAAQATRAVRANGRFTVALSGGSTPKSLYSLLATNSNIPWDKICFFWGDERHVPPDDPESNYRMADEALLCKVPVRRENVFRIHAEEKDAAVAALQYEEALRDFFRLSPSQFPRFDLILLGIDSFRCSVFCFTAQTSACSGDIIKVNYDTPAEGYALDVVDPLDECWFDGELKHMLQGVSTSGYHGTVPGTRGGVQVQRGTR